MNTWNIADSILVNVYSDTGNGIEHILSAKYMPRTLLVQRHLQINGVTQVLLSA